MNLDSLSFALSQISYSVANLTKKNFKSSVTEISHLVAQHGAEAERHLIRCLFSHVDFSGDGKSSGKDFHQTQYLIQECGSLLTKPNFISTLCYSIDNSLHHQKTLRPSSQLFSQLSRVLKLSLVQEIAFGLALLQSTNADTANHAIQFLRLKLPQLINAYINPDLSSATSTELPLQDVAEEVVHLILTHLNTHREQLNISVENKTAFVEALRKDFPDKQLPLVLTCLLDPTDYETPTLKLLPDNLNMAKLMDNSLAEMIYEVGYGFTGSLDDCRNTMMQFGARELTPTSVARVIGMMAQHHTGLTEGISVQSMNSQSTGPWENKDKPENGGPTTWNVDIFIQVVKDLAPHLNWREAVSEMDHPRFKLTDKMGLRMLMRGLFQGLQDVFPIELLYKPWKNVEGQLSWLTQALEHPDVFCLADYMVHPVSVEILKTPPDDDNREIATWKSLELVETLLRLSDAGLYQHVSKLFKFPMQHCPDMLVLSLLQTPSMVTLKTELLSNLMPIFLGNHPNSGSVLHYAWHTQGQSNAIRSLIMRCMADWYMRGEHDQTRLSRMLDVAQDLKALSMLLNATPFVFVIDLACLASRREYLKLDKWLTDKIRENREVFVNSCVSFLKRRCPQLFTGKMDESLQSKSQQLPPETVATMLACLQQFAVSVNQELSDTIMTMVQNANIIIGKSRPTPTNVVGSKPASMGNPMPGLPNPPPPPNPLDSLGPIGPFGGTNTSIGNSLGTTMGTSLGSTIGSGIGTTIGSVSVIGTSMGQTIGSSMNQPIGSSMNQPIGSSMNQPIGSPMNQPIGSSMNQPIGSSMGQAIGSSMNQPIGSSMSQVIGSMNQPIGSSMGQAIGSSMGQSMGSSMVSGMGSGMGSGMSGMGSSMGSGMSGMSGMGSGMSGMGSGMGGPLGSAIGSGLGLGGLPSVTSSVFPGGLSSLTSSTPGSPAKAFGSGGAPSQSFNSMQSLSSQLQGLNMGTNISSSLPGAPGRTPTLAGLSAAAMKTPQGPPPSSSANLSPSSSVGAEISSIFPAANQQFAKEIEDEANSYFQRIYNHPPHPTISIDEVLEMLKRFKDSPLKKEREVFACMLRNLFEEYRFFPQYPDKELHTTAVLFGGIIEQGLVTYMDLGIALRYVLEALKKSHGSKMYFFGIAALDRFKTRLKDYPQYCQHLSLVPHFSQFPPHLIEYVEYGARSQEPPNRPQGPVTSAVTMAPVGPPTTSITTTTTVTTSATPSLTPSPSVVARPGSASKPSIANATNIDTLLAGTEGKEEVTVPPENVQDKVFFIFNNLSLANMDTKAAELKDLMMSEYVAWVSQYLVMKRASIEPNFHTLYANFIDHLGNVDFVLYVLNETHRNIKVLLRSDKGVANFSDRSLLKNLGHWLGMLTLAKNKPILHDDIDLKSLVYEANMKGAQELLYVIPFVAKVIESCAKSRVFRPPNPWTMAIMNILAELHQTPGLKLNLKFEIEVLCKTLNIDLNTDLKAAMYLRDQNKAATINYQLSTPKAKEAPSTPQPEEPIVVPPNPQVPPPMPPPNTTPVVTTPPVSAPPANVVSMLLQPQFSYQDINIMASNGIDRLITINEQLQVSLFQAHPQLKQMVRQAIERAIQELLPPVVERSIKIALTTCEQIVKKDFALDPEETRMRAAAHHMVRNMTAGMALITCREPLLISITNNIKSMFQSTLRGATQAQKDLIEQAAQMIAQDNTELACAFIQKTAVEKATPEIDKKLAPEFELRKQARTEGRRYCDPVVLTYQAERMPEQIRLKVGGVTNHQFSVYEEFVRNMPGFQPEMPTNAHNIASFMPKPPPLSNTDTPPPPPHNILTPQPPGGMPPGQANFMNDEITQIYEKILREIEHNHLHTLTLGGAPNNPQIVQIHNLLDAVRMAASSREIGAAHALLQKAVEGLLDGLSAMTAADHESMLRFRDCHLVVLKGMQDQRAYGPQWTNKQITRCMMDCREDYRYNVEAVEVLIRAHLVNMPGYDQHLAQSMENGLNYMAVAFAMQLIQRFCLDDKHGPHEADFCNSYDTLSRIAVHSRQAPDGLTALIDAIRQRNDTGLLDRAPGGPTSMMHSGITQAREFDDPPGLHEKTEFLLREWVNMYHSPAAGRDSTKAFTAFVGQMHSQGILKTDDLITRFFRLCTEMCVDLCYRALAEQAHSSSLVRAKCFHTLDAFVRLITLLVKHSGDTANTCTKINLLNKVLGIVAGVLLQDHEVRQTEFQQLPYHRIFIMLFIELNAPEHVLESINFQVLTAFCNTYHILRPAKAPGFSYAWLELVSHRVFIGRLLAITPQQRVSTEGWSMYAQLLIDLFKYLAPFLRNAELGKPTQLLYKGTLRVLLVLLHDFPEFLCNYHYAFCDVIPPNCIQMRNLILSAFPRNMRLPDPFTPNLKVDMLPEINHAPHIMTNFANMIQPPSFKKDLDSYLKTRAPVTFLSELRSNLQISNEPGNRYNIPLINALVLYVGTQAIQEIHRQGLTPSMSTIAHSSHMDIFQNLAVDLDTEGRYLFLNAIANQLRYPNSHTHYFSCTLLYLFAEANAEAIQEQITRVLLERLIVSRPHPWGLLITFIELVKNPQFRFWNHEFVHCAPEISKLFDSVARSCMPTSRTPHSGREETAEAH